MILFNVFYARGTSWFISDSWASEFQLQHRGGSFKMQRKPNNVQHLRTTRTCSWIVGQRWLLYTIAIAIAAQSWAGSCRLWKGTRLRIWGCRLKSYHDLERQHNLSSDNKINVYAVRNSCPFSFLLIRILAILVRFLDWDHLDLNLYKNYSSRTHN